MKTLKLVLKFIIGILALPLAASVSIAFYNNIVLVEEFSKSMGYFIWGIVTYAILHIVFYKPTFLYCLGHEAVHAGTAWLFGGKVKSFKVTEEGGSVTTDKSNTIIELSPYFIPIYAIIIMAVYFILVSSYNINGSIFIYLIGFALSLHMISTIEVLKIRQPDIVKSGYFFSIIFVYILNIIVIALIFSMVFPAFSLKKFCIGSWVHYKSVAVVIMRQLFVA